LIKKEYQEIYKWSIRTKFQGIGEY
jgi:hypothetical protein